MKATKIIFLNSNPCDVCGGVCLMKKNTIAVTHQLILEDFEREMPVTGPDTFLYNWQKARSVKDWRLADEVKLIGLEMGFSPAFCGDHYEVHDIHEKRRVYKRL